MINWLKKRVGFHYSGSDALFEFQVLVPGIEEGRVEIIVGAFFKCISVWIGQNEFQRAQEKRNASYL